MRHNPISDLDLTVLSGATHDHCRTESPSPGISHCPPPDVEQKKIVIVGGGISGLIIAHQLAIDGFKVLVREKRSEVLQETSKETCCRIHTGGHYPHSQATREELHKGWYKFVQRYKELDFFLEKTHSLYVVEQGNLSLHGQVAEEFKYVGEIERDSIDHILGTPNKAKTAYENNELFMRPTAQIAPILRKELAKLGVDVKCDKDVVKISRLPESEGGGQRVIYMDGSFEVVDDVVIATGGKKFTPDNLPYNAQLKPQVCALVKLTSKKPRDKAVAHIGVAGNDGRVCLMPHDRAEDGRIEAILTATKDTIFHSGPLNECEEVCRAVEEGTPEGKILVAKAMNRVREAVQSSCPKVEDDWEFGDVCVTTLLKPVTEEDYRSSMCYRSKDTGLYHVTSGKAQDGPGIGEQLTQHMRCKAKEVNKNEEGALRGEFYEVTNGCEVLIGGTMYKAGSKYKVFEKDVSKQATCHLEPYADEVKAILGAAGLATTSDFVPTSATARRPVAASAPASATARRPVAASAPASATARRPVAASAPASASVPASASALVNGVRNRFFSPLSASPYNNRTPTPAKVRSRLGEPAKRQRHVARKALSEDEIAEEEKIKAELRKRVENRIQTDPFMLWSLLDRTERELRPASSGGTKGSLQLSSRFPPLARCW